MDSMPTSNENTPLINPAFFRIFEDADEIPQVVGDAAMIWDFDGVAMVCQAGWPGRRGVASRSLEHGYSSFVFNQSSISAIFLASTSHPRRCAARPNTTYHRTLQNFGDCVPLSRRIAHSRGYPREIQIASHSSQHGHNPAAPSLPPLSFDTTGPRLSLEASRDMPESPTNSPSHQVVS
ncbi:hypothetical protein BDZ89DRAFT_1131581 [Hymenopellis radicata]|nr:hypothetical protein BDZ89DRAFT_1131581 [Hymenopellis radicata]